MLSVASLTKEGFQILFTEEGGSIIDQYGKLIASLGRKGNLFILVEDAHLVDHFWHSRLGHTSNKNLKRLNILKDTKQEHSCKGCLQGKMKDHRHHSREEYAAEPLSHLHTDSTVPLPKVINNHRYALLLLDEMSRFFITTTCCNKSEFPGIIKDIITR